MSFHFRRTDFLRVHVDVASSVEHAASALVHACKQAQVSDVFIATDTTKDEVGQLQRALARHHVHLHRFVLPDGDTQAQRLQAAAIEQIIASLGNVFVGTARSHFAKEIHFERRVRLANANGSGMLRWFRSSRALIGDGITIPLCHDPEHLGARACESLPVEASLRVPRVELR